MEMQIWRASEHDGRVALQNDIKERVGQSLFVKMGDDDLALRSWTGL